MCSYLISTVGANKRQMRLERPWMFGINVVSLCGTRIEGAAVTLAGI